MCYWIVHALEILCAADELSSSTTSAIVDFLKRCQDPTGGFCGGPSPGHSPHLAPTYAAVNALLTLGTADAYAALARAAERLHAGTTDTFWAEKVHPNEVGHALLGHALPSQYPLPMSW